MENREKVVEEYLKLRILLNRSNPKANQRTDVDFVIISKKRGRLVLFATLYSPFDKPMLELCFCDYKSTWEASGYSGLNHLERFCAKYIEEKLGDKLGVPTTEFLALALKKELRSLGISK